MLSFRKRIRSSIRGTVVSVKHGNRCRVTIDGTDGLHRFFMSEATVKIGDKVRDGSKLGYK